MNDSFWEPVFKKLLDNLQLLKNICQDTSDKKLISWIKPNKHLWLSCAKHIRNNKVTHKNELIEAIINFAKKDLPLRKIIFYSWIETNEKTMNYTTLPMTSENLQELQEGKYGDYKKILVLSQIDPRDGVKEKYDHVLNKLATNNQSKDENLLKYCKELENKLSQSQQTTQSAKDELKALKQKEQNARHELSCFQKNLAARDMQIFNLEKLLHQNSAELEKIMNQSISQSQKTDCTKCTKIQSETQNKPAQNNSDENNQKLLKALENRNKKIKRLKSENQQLKNAIKNIEDQQKQVENLQKMLREKTHDSQLTTHAGRIICKTNKSEWIFETITGKTFNIEKSIKKRINLEELSLLKVDANNNPVYLESLENNNKKELTGYIIKESNGLFLVTQHQKHPVHLDVAEKLLNEPVKGIWLPAIKKRPAGLYNITGLKSARNKTAQPKKIKAPKIAQTKYECQPDKKFDGQKVVIFGGDRIGKRYEQYFSKLNLEIKWFSGFKNLGSVREGLNNNDLIVLILKQISHTVLREISASVVNCPILYCTKRGLSGVKKEIEKNLK